MKVAIVILTYNSAGYQTACLKSVQRLKTGSVKILPIVVDNASRDKSVSLVRNNFPQFTLIANRENLGYAEGNNVGIRRGLSMGADFIWIVNPDVTLHPDSLSALVAAAKIYPGAGVFGSKIYFAPGFEFHKDRYTQNQLGKVIWSAGGTMDWANMLGSNRGIDEVDHGQYDQDVETDYVTGASLFVRSQVVNQVGLFDQKFFLYYEENDFCQRVLKAGWKLMYIPKSVVWHANAQATVAGSPLIDYYTSRNRMLFGLRYAPVYTRLLLIKLSVILLLTGRTWEKRGVIDFYLRRFGRGSYHS